MANTTAVSEDVAAKVRAIEDSTDGDVGDVGQRHHARWLLANMAPGDHAWWEHYRSRLERVAHEASRN